MLPLSTLKVCLSDLDYDLTALGTFYNPGLSFNAFTP